MKRKLNILAGDAALWVVFIILSVISLVAVYSTIGYSAITESASTPMTMFMKHLGFVVVSFVIVILLSKIDYRKFSKLSVVGLAVAFVCLLIVMVAGGRRLNVFGLVAFQPSEFAKIVLMVYLARVMALNKENLSDKNVFFRLLAVIAIVCILVVGENLSMAVLIFVASYILLFLGGVNRRLWWQGFFVLAVLGSIGFAVIYFFGDQMDFLRTSTWGHRLQAWINPDPDELTQENMARMAVARGGFFGSGIGTTIHGRLMTQAHNDFIFAIIIEETGMFAAMIIFALYAMFYFRCIRIANACSGVFGSLSVAGIGTVIFLQAIINMSVAVGVMPVTGQNLPFISYGGSSYLFLAGGMAVIQSVARDNKKQQRLAQRLEAEGDGACIVAPHSGVSNIENDTL